MDYTVDPGLYALGRPDADSIVLVTANYKMSFDRLREALPDRNAWILVLDTKGINVWCAAGKGTFGTGELISKIESSRLVDLIRHRNIIVPQLGGPGISAHEVKRLSGFRVIYGPVAARDLPAFIDSGMKATPQMRAKTFPISERVALIPIELVAAMRVALLIAPFLFLLGGLGAGGFWANAMEYGLFAVFSLLGAVAAGAVLTPILLPWIPGRAFSLKGFNMGLATALFLGILRGFFFSNTSAGLEWLAWLLLVPAASSYLGMNFTGASTYTSLSGVKKEMRLALPMQIAATTLGLILWLASRLTT